MSDTLHPSDTFRKAAGLARAAGGGRVEPWDLRLGPRVFNLDVGANRWPLPRHAIEREAALRAFGRSAPPSTGGYGVHDPGMSVRYRAPHMHVLRRSVGEC